MSCFMFMREGGKEEARRKHTCIRHTYVYILLCTCGQTIRLQALLEHQGIGICMSVYIYIYIYTHIYMYYVYTNRYMYVYVYMYVYIYIYTHTNP
jgi:hypothetical protein